MSEIRLDVSFPLDDDGFFRRQCPLCRWEFKIQLPEEDLTTLAQKGLQNYLVDEGLVEAPEDLEPDETQFMCPYCGQESDHDSWWTEEQARYIQVFAHNIAARIVNEQLVRPLKRQAKGRPTDLISIRIEATEMKYVEPWISPEESDMTPFELPCCNRRIKVLDEWLDVVHCYFCGFSHRPRPS